MIWPPANAIYRRETHDNYPAAKAILQAVYRGPAAADGPRAQGRVALVRQDPALEGSGGDDPHAVRLDAGAEQGRAPARRTCRRRHLKKVGVARRRLHGRGRRLCDGERRHRGRARRPRHGGGREGQGPFAQAHDRPDHEGPRQDRRSRRAARPHHAERPITAISRTATSSSRPCSRIPKVKAEVIAEGRGGRSARTAIFASNTSTLPISGLAKTSKRPDRVHRHPFLLAGREDDAGRDHHGQGDRRQGARHGARLCARHQEDADRRQRRARLLRQPLRRAPTSSKAT